MKSVLICIYIEFTVIPFFFLHSFFLAFNYLLMKKSLDSGKANSLYNNINEANNINQDINSYLFNRLNSDFIEESDQINVNLRDDKIEDNIEGINNYDFQVSQDNSQNLSLDNSENIREEGDKIITNPQPKMYNKKREAKNKNKKIFFACDFKNCEKEYRSRENLKLHVQNVHEQIKPYGCRFCDATFSHRNGKTYHERKMHINYLPYKCTSHGKNLYLFYYN